MWLAVVNDGYGWDIGKNSSNRGSDGGGDGSGVIRDSDEYYKDTVTDDRVSVGDNEINGTVDEMCAVNVDTGQQC